MIYLEEDLPDGTHPVDTKKRRQRVIALKTTVALNPYLGHSVWINILDNFLILPIFYWNHCI
jgi:hypothetical protein